MTYTNNTISDAVVRGMAAAGDPARPDDGSKSAFMYARMSDDFRQGAWRHLRDDGDLPQASNKAWGMVAETVKAISAHHGSVIHTHRSIWLVLRELAELVKESGDPEMAAWINNSFRSARGLHANFYENEESPQEVEQGLQLSEELSERLYQLFWPDRSPA